MSEVRLQVLTTQSKLTQTRSILIALSDGHAILGAVMTPAEARRTAETLLRQADALDIQTLAGPARSRTAS